MCYGDKMQLPYINKGAAGTYSFNTKNELEYSQNNSIQMNNSIRQDDLCYNRYPNGEAPQVDATTGHYICYVPALITYQVKNGASGSSDTLDTANSYTVSCQSTDLPDISQTGKSGYAVMFGTPILIKSGLYEDPAPPNTVRSSNYTASGDNKWMCKRIMHGAPTKEMVQSPYESISKSLVSANDIASSKVKDAITGGENSKIQFVEQTNTTQTPIGLSYQDSSTSIPVTIPGSAVIVNPNSGAVTRTCNPNSVGDCVSQSLTSSVPTSISI
jgi:hypothetical protein